MRAALRALDRHVRDDFGDFKIHRRLDAHGRLLFGRQRIVTFRAGERRAPEFGESTRRASAREQPIATRADGRGCQQSLAAIGTGKVKLQATAGALFVFVTRQSKTARTER
jgi:hypothetical protein